MDSVLGTSTLNSLSHPHSLSLLHGHTSCSILLTGTPSDEADLPLTPLHYHHSSYTHCNAHQYPLPPPRASQTHTSLAQAGLSQHINAHATGQDDVMRSQEAERSHLHLTKRWEVYASHPTHSVTLQHEIRLLEVVGPLARLAHPNTLQSGEI